MVAEEPNPPEGNQFQIKRVKPYRYIKGGINFRKRFC
jgi:hypothetical protein